MVCLSVLEENTIPTLVVCCRGYDNVNTLLMIHFPECPRDDHDLSWDPITPRRLCASIAQYVGDV